MFALAGLFVSALMHSEFCWGLFEGVLRGGSAPQAILQFPDFGSRFADKKQKLKTNKPNQPRAMCRGGVAAGASALVFFYFLKALFYIPCNTGGESAGLIGHCFAVAIQCLSIHLPPPGWCDLGVQLAFFTVTTRRLCSSFKPNHISYFTLEGFYNFLFTLLKTVFKSFEMRDFFLFLAAFNIIAICVWGLMAGRCKSGGLQRDRPGFFFVFGVETGRDEDL